MCDGCWNAKIFAEKVRSRSLCTGQEMMTMSYDKLQHNLTQEWIKSDETEFFIFRKAIHDGPLERKIQIPVNNGTKRSSLKVNFI